MNIFPQLQGSAAHVWSVELTPEAFTAFDNPPSLTPEEYARAARFKRNEDRERFLAGREILRRLLGNYCGTSPGAIRFATNEFGKPRLAGAAVPPVFFNMSHTGATLLYAFSRQGEVGVDVERFRSTTDRDRLVTRFFSVAETSAFFALPERKRTVAFFDYWACKEAVLKALGVGLSLGLNTFTVTFGAPNPTVRFDGARRFPEVAVRQIPSGDGIAAAAAFVGFAPEPMDFFPLFITPENFDQFENPPIHFRKP